MPWRPEGWNNIYSLAYKNCHETQPEFAIQAGMQGLAFEAGADAMFEALREHGYETMDTFGEGPYCSGKEVFIPDDD